MTSFTGWGSSWGSSWGSTDPNALSGTASFSFTASLQVNAGEMQGTASFSITATLVSQAETYSQEVSIRPRKWYVKRKKQILLFNSPEEADAFIESEAVAEKAIEQAQKTSRRARKRLRDKIITVTPEVVDTDYLSSLVDRFNIPVNLPSLIAQQDYDRVMQIMQLATEMQDEEDVELLLLM